MSAASNHVSPINLRSDTQTLPTQRMREAIAAAELGDDTYHEDPTVARLQVEAAARLGKPAALLVPSGHMGNLIALMVHAGPGDCVLVDRESHIHYYECGSVASVAGVMPEALQSREGLLDPDEVAAAVREPDVHYARARVLCLENTHNRSGGRVMSVEHQRSLCDVAHEAGLVVHLDGARLFNAAVAQGVEPSALVADVDSVMFCLTKGLSCPLGSLLVGSEAFIAKAEQVRRRLGGGMRQAGIIAAAGIVALQTMVDRLADDHRRARRLAEGLDAAGKLRVDPTSVQSNMVYADHRGLGLSTDEVLRRLARAGVIGSERPPHHVRFVTHRHHDDEAIEEALRRIERALASG